MIDKRQRQLDERITPVSSRIDVHAEVLVGTPFLAIIREVLRNRRDLVVKVSSEDGGIGAQLFGSTDMHQLRKCPSPVWMMHPEKPATYRRILTAIDFDPYERTTGEKALNIQILEMAASLALSEFAELHIVHVWWAYVENELLLGFAQMQREKVDAYVAQERRAHKAWLDGFLAKFFDSVGKDAEDYLKPWVHLKKGRAHEVIPELATELQAGVIVMGTVARTGVPGLIMGYNCGGHPEPDPLLCSGHQARGFCHTGNLERVKSMNVFYISLTLALLLIAVVGMGYLLRGGGRWRSGGVNRDTGSGEVGGRGVITKINESRAKNP